MSESETSETRAVRKSGEQNMLWRLSDCCLGRCVEWSADRGRRAVRRNGGLNAGRRCDVMWVFLQSTCDGM